ncbi:conserved hypothetical protein (DUF4480) [Formosa sp. Hel1_33_131]|jgi:hypothetical protein|uniref:carboxypeptidase-like regulatory domain-containing protein n=1 Tax=Formosa sp. Hel1_33_131 TaxID=1336794 RepID=UPI00084E2790|nr:carboxypeptidase-like regulatory domain-containing protein [Formosa sp. Hel1_33_131]AOR27345.1 conserved hypothetical protein (DUF4480) [Formosa sp. Hel1_33_131]
MFKKNLIIFFVSLVHISVFSQSEIIVESEIVDVNEQPLAFTSISIMSKSIGTISNEDGRFYLKLTKENLNDTITISTLGFKSFKIMVQDFIDQKIEIVTLEEDLVSLDEIVIQDPSSYVKSALKKLKETTYSKGHQLNILYRRFSNENNVSRFLVEHYVKVYDNGPTSREFGPIEIVEARKSNDYRFAKKKQKFHAIKMIAKQNPLRIRINPRNYKWKIVDDTSYDGEDVIVLEGKVKNKKNKWIKLYIGSDTNNIYRLEKSDLNAVYIYKKTKDGTMVLSYHNREYVFREKVSPQTKRLLKLKEDEIKLSYRHEAIVLGIETNRKKIRVSENIKPGKDIGDYNLKYDSEFWKSVSLPPDSKFYKESSKQLENIYGIPIETQFKRVKN